jgi:arsenite transporter
MGLFERYLSVWVALAILIGIAMGNVLPEAFAAVASWEFAQVNFVIAGLIWLMIYPMMVQIDFSSIKDVGKRPQGLVLTLCINWLIKPFSMALLGWLFFKVLFAPWVDPQTATEYVAGMILLGVTRYYGYYCTMGYVSTISHFICIGAFIGRRINTKNVR